MGRSHKSSFQWIKNRPRTYCISISILYQFILPSFTWHLINGIGHLCYTFLCSVLFCSVLSSAYDEIRYWDDVYFFLRMIGTLFIEVHVTHQITSNPIECKSHLHKVCFIEAYNFLNLVSIFNFDAFFSFSTFFLRIVKVGNRNCLGFKQWIRHLSAYPWRAGFLREGDVGIVFREHSPLLAVDSFCRKKRIHFVFFQMLADRERERRQPWMGYEKLKQSDREE